MAEQLADVLEKHPRFRQVLLEADVWWEEDGTCVFHTVMPDDPELHEGAAAFAEAMGITVENLPPDAPPPALPPGPPSRFGDRPRRSSRSDRSIGGRPRGDA